MKLMMKVRPIMKWRPREICKWDMGGKHAARHSSAQDASSLLQVRRTAEACIANLCLHLPGSMLGDLSGPVQSACALLASLEWAWAQAPALAADSAASPVGGWAWVVAETEALTMLLCNASRHRPQLEQVDATRVRMFGRDTGFLVAL